MKLKILFTKKIYVFLAFFSLLHLMFFQMSAQKTVKVANRPQGTLSASHTNLTINSGTSLVMGASIKLIFSDGDTLTNKGTFTATNSTDSVLFRGAGKIQGSASTVFKYIAIKGPVDFGNNSTIGLGSIGVLSINSGGSVTGSYSPVYATGSVLMYNTGGSVGRGLEWSSNNPHNVTISNNSAFQLGANSGTSTARTCTGTLTVHSGSSFTMASPAMTAGLNVNGNIVLNGTLALSTSAGADLSVSGNWTRNSGSTFSPGISMVNFLGAGSSLISAPSSSSRNSYGVFGGEIFYDLSINKNAKAVTVSNASGVNITVLRKLVLTKGTLNLSDSNIVLASNAAGTADLETVNSNNAAVNYSSTGRFIVQRFIPNPGYVRTWRYLTAPLQANDPVTINHAWQGGVCLGNPSPGFGTLITGPGGNTNGFDTSSGNKYSIQYFRNYTTPNSWGYPANTGVRLMSQPAWVIFIRGDRTSKTNGPYFSAGNVTLEPKGKINIGDTTYTITNGKFNLIGNPYPAQINMATVTDGSNNPHPPFRVWDPKGFLSYGQTGTYILFKYLAGSYQQTNNAGTTWTSPGTIESGEAIMIDTLLKSTAIHFHESDKVSATSSLNGIQSRPSGPAPVLTTFFTKLGFYDTTASTYNYIDGTSNLYYPDFDPAVNAEEDYIAPITGPGSVRIFKDGYQLYFDAEPTISEGDTIKLNTKLNPGKHRLAFYTKNFYSILEPYIFDRFMGDSTAMVINNTDSTFVDFTVTADPLSNDLNRFMVIFKASTPSSLITPLPVKFNSVKAVRQPKEISVEWSVENELNIIQYDIERSVDGIVFYKENTTVALNNRSTAVYNWLDPDPENGVVYYRIKSVSADGTVGYSQTIKVNGLNLKQTITVYPNPIKNNRINLQFEGQKPGNFQLQIFSSSGQLVFTKTIFGGGNNWSESVLINTVLPHGSYQTHIINPDGEKYIRKVVVE